MPNSGATGGVFSGRPNYDLVLSAWRSADSGNSSQWYWELHARHVSGGVSYDLTSRPWYINVGGHTASGGGVLDFRSTNDRLVGAGYTAFIPHDSAGNLWMVISASMGPAGIFGTANAGAVGFSANRILQVPSQPSPPTLVSATPTVLNVSLPYPGDDGGTGVTSFDMSVATAPDVGAIIQSRNSPSSAQTFTGLTPATTYYIQHRAVNAVGPGATSAWAAMSTATSVPTQPQSPYTSAPSPTGMTLNWSPPANNGGGPILNYDVYRATDPAFTQNVIGYNAGLATSLAFTDMLPSTTYYFVVYARNSAGYSPASAVVAGATVSGVSFSTGSAWVPAGVFVSNGSAWIPAEIFVSNGTTWIAAI